jgi:hypothetical protein
MIFWAVTPSNDVIGYHHIGGPCCLHNQWEVQIQIYQYSNKITNCTEQSPSFKAKNHSTR